MRAYDELYLSDAMSNLGGAFHYAINDCGIPPDQFMEEFLQSDLSKEFEAGNPWVLSGMSGIELTQRVLESIRPGYPFPSPSPAVFKTPEYWAGYYLAYFQWFTGIRFKDIFARVKLTEIIAMYPVYHEMDVTNFVEDISQRLDKAEAPSRLKALRERAGYSQSQLAKKANVGIRMIQLYEQRAANIDNARTSVLYRLARALRCNIEDLLERPEKRGRYVPVEKGQDTH